MNQFSTMKKITLILLASMGMFSLAYLEPVIAQSTIQTNGDK